MKVLTRVLAAASLVAASFIPATFAAPAAGACAGVTTIAVGGFNDGGAGVFAGRANVHAHYSGALNDMEGGIGALAGVVDQVRRDCPGTHIQLAGHSQGAAIVHVYLSRHGLHNGSAVLYSDPKQAGTGEADGLFMLGGPPIAGTDANFRGVPTLSICNVRDVICNRGAGLIGWWEYATTPVHVAYDFNPRAHLGRTGVLWQ